MYLNRKEVESLLWQIGGRGNFDAVYEVPSWMNIYDKMPHRMKLAFNLKMQGLNTKEISKEMGVSLRTARHHIQHAKKRIVNSLLNYS